MGDIISVIIPIYNMEQSLARCLESIRKQTYSNIEVIMINDGSLDMSEDICIEYRNMDTRFLYYKQKNSGVSSARNKGIKYANGEWICFIDPDDYLEDSMIQKMYEFASSDCDIVACCCVAEVDGKSIVNSFFEDSRLFAENKFELFMQLLDNNYNASSYRYTAIGVPWGKLYRKKFIENNNLFFHEELKRMQDNIFNFEAFCCAEKIYYINEALYHYVVEHVNQYVRTYDAKAEIYLSEVIRYQYEILNEMNLISNKQVFDAFIKEVISLFILVVQKSYYYCKDIDNVECNHRAQRLIKQEPFLSIFEKSKNTLKVNFFVFFIKKGLVVLLIELKEIFKKMKQREL